MLSSRFRFAERVIDEFVESECDRGLRAPLTEAITRSAVARDGGFDV
jgi:hypothetical protein